MFLDICWCAAQTCCILGRIHLISAQKMRSSVKWLVKCKHLVYVINFGGKVFGGKFNCFFSTMLLLFTVNCEVGYFVNTHVMSVRERTVLPPLTVLNTSIQIYHSKRSIAFSSF